MVPEPASQGIRLNRTPSKAICLLVLVRNEISHLVVMKYLPPSRCKLLVTPCIIKNKLNPTIMSCCDNQKPLIHFLRVPPSTHQLPECIFPMSFESVSPRKKRKKCWGGNHEKPSQVPVAPLSITGTRCPSSSSRRFCGRLCTCATEMTSQDGKWCQGSLEQRCGSLAFSFCPRARGHGSIHRTGLMVYKCGRRGLCSGGETSGDSRCVSASILC